MVNELILPLMGEGVVEAQIGRWLKAVGDPVSEGEPIVEVETDKVTTELESDFEGTLLQILVPEGETAVLHQVLAVIGGENSQQSTVNNVAEQRFAQQSTINAQQSTMLQSNASPNAQSSAIDSKTYNGRISPVVKRMVREHSLDLSMVAGTGKDGRITKRDVVTYLEKDEDKGQKAETNRQSSIVNRKSTINNQQSTINNQQSTISLNTDLLSLSNMRRKIAEHMVFSKQESPHATTVFEIDFEAVSTHRALQKEDFKRRGVKLTYMAYIGMAVVQALQQVPKANSQWSEQGIVLHRDVHLGMATAVDNGLIVPVIKNGDTLNLFGMAHAVDQLAQKGRAGQLQTADLQGGTFTITNHGVFGSLFATPIINQPQSGILGIGAIEKRVCVVNDMIAIRPKAYFSFSFDHRILDGADADRFMQIVKQLIEEWV